MVKENEPLKESAKRELFITRIFNAPRNIVFKAWADTKHMAQWWGPKDFTNPVCELDVHPGGSIRIDMTGPDGVVYPMGGTFHEIIEPERLVFTSTAFENEEDNWQLEALNTVTFTEQNGKTKLTLHAVVIKWTPKWKQRLLAWNRAGTKALTVSMSSLRKYEMVKS